MKRATLRFSWTMIACFSLSRAEHQRNLTACLNGYGCCDRSLLTPREVRPIPQSMDSVR